MAKKKVERTELETIEQHIADIDAEIAALSDQPVAHVGEVMILRAAIAELKDERRTLVIQANKLRAN